MSELNQYTQEQLAQLVDYLLFEQQKRKETKTEISSELADLLEQQIDPDTLYSGKDALELLHKLPTSIKKTVGTELERNRDISAVLFEQLFKQAQEANLIIEFNIPDLEDEANTDQARVLCSQILMNKDKIVSNQQISTPKTHTEQPNLEAIQKEIAQLRAENEKLEAQLKKPKREWPEFQEATQLLKARNAEFHDLQSKLEKK